MKIIFLNGRTKQQKNKYMLNYIEDKFIYWYKTLNQFRISDF